ncbi:hypothetical protein IGI04_006238 [Brassica rapa subsp. trilocularis]|uniref:Uncharacterized protein n=3 Tax=Brassica TaxID=3705 RepID=A0A3P6AW49_BRACM|nr:hypothetical protein IGI04_006238 [Brassica rapa subsp. trilocularis]CAF2139376.1 unnamed protein product [Brassica napus]CAG7893298.1 unnamed protein product [Brassica rapa]VDC88308.1 unnamed protein product [Brassica rapa]
MLVGAVTSIVRKFLRSETMEAKEITVATLFSLSLADENKIIIGASGVSAAPGKVHLLELLRKDYSINSS